jgi:hypothetical protein
VGKQVPPSRLGPYLPHWAFVSASHSVFASRSGSIVTLHPTPIENHDAAQRCRVAAGLPVGGQNNTVHDGRPRCSPWPPAFTIPTWLFKIVRNAQDESSGAGRSLLLGTTRVPPYRSGQLFIRQEGVTLRGGLLARVTDTA